MEQNKSALTAAERLERTNLAVDQQVQHVVPLPANLKTSFNPIKFSTLEKLGGCKRSEKVFFLLSFRRSVMQLIKHKTLQQFLIADSDFDRI